MALITKYYLVEQIRALLGGGSPSAGAKFEPRMIASHLQQAINAKLKVAYFTETLPGEETIPEGAVLACYDGIPVEKYKGCLSRAKLPAQPVYFRRNMGIYFVGPAVKNLNLGTPELVAVTYGDSQILLTWGIIPHAASYLLERATESDYSDAVAIYNSNALTFTDTGLDGLTIYYYRITAMADNYESSGYGLDSATTGTSIFSDTFGLTFN